MTDGYIIRLAVCLAVGSMCCEVAQSQTRVDGGKQVRNVDFSQAMLTKPHRTGAILPAACSAGETFFKTGEEGMGRLHICVAADTWRDASEPLGHAASHRAGGADEVASEIPAAGEIPRAGINGRLAVGWIASGLADGTKYVRDDGTLQVPEVAAIRGNVVAAGVPSGEGQFYGWNSQQNRFMLFQWGDMFSLSGGSVNLASEVVPRYSASSTVPATCSNYGVFHFDTSSSAGGKMYYCNGAEFERVQSGSGTVSSVGLSITGSTLFSVSGSPVTGSGTIQLTASGQSANQVLAGPVSGEASAPVFRALTAADIPSLDSSKLVSGVIATARLGSGVADASTFLRGDGTWAGTGAPLDPLGSAFEYDDFYLTNTTSGQLGKLGWTAVLETGGSITATNVAEVNHPGILQLNIGGTASTSARIQLGSTNGATPLTNLAAAAGWEFVYVFRVTTAIDSNSYTRVGLGDLNGSGGDYLTSFAQLVEAQGTGNFYLKSCNNVGVCDAVDTGVTPAQGTWYRVRLYSEVAGTLKAQISADGGGYSSPVSLAIKASSGTLQTPILLVGTADTTSRSMQIDYYQQKIPVVR